MLSTEFQYAALAVLAFEDKGKIIAKILTHEHFDGALAVVASRLIDRWQKAEIPAQDVEFDLLLEDLSEGPQKQVYENIKKKIRSACGVNPDFVLEKSGKFVTMQKVRSTLTGALRSIERSGEDELDAILASLREAAKPREMSFDRGVSITPEFFDRILQNPRGDPVNLGIPELDRVGAHPGKKELFVVAAPVKGGKSWFLVHIANSSAYAAGKSFVCYA